MRVIELVAELRKRFPRSPIEAWEDTYFAALRRFEGEPLARAFQEIIAEWAEPGPPKPAHIAAAVKIERAKPDDKLSPTERTDIERLKRARAIFETAKHECAWACKQDWGGYAKIHLFNAAHFIARHDGMATDVALAMFNGGDNRPGYPKRDPGMWLDDYDYEIFAKRLASQKRVRTRFNKLSPFNDNEPQTRKVSA